MGVMGVSGELGTRGECAEPGTPSASWEAVAARLELETEREGAAEWPGSRNEGRRELLRDSERGEGDTGGGRPSCETVTAGTDAEDAEDEDGGGRLVLVL